MDFNFYYFSRKYRPEIDIKILILSLIILVIGILINFYNNNTISRSHYPFTTQSTGYNLLGLISGLIFFTLCNYYFENNKNIYFVLQLLLITFFTLSKSAILSLFIIFIFYNLIFIRSKSIFNIYYLYQLSY